MVSDRFIPWLAAVNPAPKAEVIKRPAYAVHNSQPATPISTTPAPFMITG